VAGCCVARAAATAAQTRVPCASTEMTTGDLSPLKFGSIRPLPTHFSRFRVAPDGDHGVVRRIETSR
jgi:hypothetical protein